MTAKYRWCLTGTPIHNSLDDLGSLVSFLRIPLLQSRATFRRAVARPIEEARCGGDRNLRLLLESICLRRTRGLLGLREPEETVCNVESSVEERELYTRVGERARGLVDEAISQSNTSSPYAVVLQTIMRLRRICNHGTMDQDFVRDLSRERTADADDYQLADEISQESATCAKCFCEVAAAAGITYGAHCRHFLCTDCYVEYSETGPSQTATRCSICHSTRRPDLSTRLDEDGRPPLDLKGHSTKLARLVENIRHQHKHQHKWFVRSSRDALHILTPCSIVFSSWTKSLDAVAAAMNQAGLSFFRIDGKLCQAERRSALEKFQMDDSVAVLLTTLGTGAVGYVFQYLSLRARTESAGSTLLPRLIFTFWNLSGTPPSSDRLSVGPRGWDRRGR